MPFLGNLILRRALRNPEVQGWVKLYLRCAPPDIFYEMIKEVLAPGQGWEAADITHVLVTYSTLDGAAWATGGCTCKAAVSPQGECKNPAHIYIGCELIMNTLKERYPNLPELLEKSRASLAGRADG